jgi:hypothetical protein
LGRILWTVAALASISAELDREEFKREGAKDAKEFKEIKDSPPASTSLEDKEERRGKKNFNSAHKTKFHFGFPPRGSVSSSEAPPSGR